MAGETNDPMPKVCTISGTKRSYRHELTVEPVASDGSVVSGKMFDATTGELAGTTDTHLMVAPAAKVATEMVKDYQQRGFSNIQAKCDF